MVCVCACMCLCMCVCMCAGVVCVCMRACVLGHTLQITERAQNKHLILPLKTSNFASLNKPQQNRLARGNYKRLAHDKKKLKRSPNSGIRKRLGHSNPTRETLQPSAKRYQRPAMFPCLSSQKASYHAGQLESAGV